MENLMPPSGGSPEEIQAWNDMMDTMVTFIKASTNLMNTITKKVRPGMDNATEGCEPECLACQPKPPCAICGKGASQTALKTPTSSKTQGMKAASASRQSPVAEVSEEDEAAEGGEAEGDEENEGGENAEDEENAEGGDAPAEEKPSVVQPSATASKTSGGGGGSQCTCAAIRAKRLENEKKDQCPCTAKNVIGEEGELEPERMCGCGPTPGNTEAMVQEMIEKLANAQREIMGLQEEMARLQRMDASKRTGPHAGPNPAALYREIMKDSGPRPHSFNQPQHGAPFQGFSPSPYGPPPNLPFRPSPGCPGNARFQTPGAPGPMMRPPSLMQQTSMQGMGSGAPGMPPPRYYPGRSPSNSRSPGMTAAFDDSSGQNYWNRQPQYGSPGGPNLTQMIECPWGSRNSPQSNTPQMSPPRRRIICGPPPSASSDNDCDPSCTLRSM